MHRTRRDTELLDPHFFPDEPIRITVTSCLPSEQPTTVILGAQMDGFAQEKGDDEPDSKADEAARD